MSLFKVRDFWTFDLDALHLQTEDETNTDTPLETEDGCREGNFTAAVGRFHSTGHQDVFVCGDLRGAVYIIQVPASDQRRYIREGKTVAAELSASSTGMSSPSSNSTSGSQGIEDRQLLAATNLNMPVVDIRCGYFTSATKQSVAVLSLNKLLILQVRRHRVSADPLIDSLIEGESENYQTDDIRSRKAINESLLSHEFEEYVRIDLLKTEFACNLLVLNSHSDGSLSDINQKEIIKEAELDNSTRDNQDKGAAKFAKRSKLVVQQLHLPQRDKLIVQYVNQFLFTLIDSKKIVGHFSALHSAGNISSGESDEKVDQQPDAKVERMSESLGCMPMAFMYSNRSPSSLIVSFSDHRIYSVPLDKLTSLARQDVMKRVALNLLQTDDAPKSANNLSSSIRDKDDKSSRIISVDMESVSGWSYELMASPIQMTSLQRRAKSVNPSVGNKDELMVSQLLLMTRYSLDLFSACGKHLWSQRFEAPLIYSFAYTLDSTSADHSDEQSRVVISLDDDKQKVQFKDNLLSLLCTDCLTAGKSNLMILKEEQVQWSALLNAKPYRIWRLNLAHMPGLLSMLDIKQGQLIVSYLGTNSDTTSDTAPEVSGENTINIADLTKLELLQDTPIDGSSSEAKAHNNIHDEQRKRLRFQANLDASGKWPDVNVEVCMQIHLDANSTGVIHDIVATLEFDDLIGFSLIPGDNQSIVMLSFPARGVARVQLGNCWPDRREPMTLRGRFSLSRSLKATFNDDVLDDRVMQPNKSNLDGRLMPKSLKVSVLLSYNETHSSLLVQDESFLLPISMISQLTHLDYTNGVGQTLDDVMNNLGRPKPEKDRSKQFKYFCDLFLELDCDIMGLLDEFVERDLICRAKFSSTSIELGANRRNKPEGHIETLENINLLAQSLECRLRYKNPFAMARQSSEELIVPIMASFALLMDNDFNITEREQATNQINSLSDDSNTVWIHICDLSKSETSVPEELVMRHMKDWVTYRDHKETPVRTERETDTAYNLLVSIESDQPLQVILVLSHLLDRTHCLGTKATRGGPMLLETNDYENYQTLFDSAKNGCSLAINVSLHDALRSSSRLLRTTCEDRLRSLSETLAREFCKFQMVTAAILDLSKRLPALLEDNSQQMRNMNLLIKNYHQKIASTLDELQSLRDTDYQSSKLPYVPFIKLKSNDNRNRDQVWSPWTEFID